LINNQADIAIGAPDTLLDGGGIDYIEIGMIRWLFAISPAHPLAFIPEPISESQLRLYPNIMVEDTANTINKKVGWLLHGQESILVPDFNTKLQCQILGEGIGFLPDYMVREAMEKSLLVTRQIHNPRQDSRMLLATRHSASGQVTQWIKREFSLQGILTGIYQDLMHRA
ncbi:TPA: LysR family transcriptional regulator, partial [Escherichia coli]|nr:LysR family transcriptional regulator [Escherichia coli]EJC0057923.1 LysR family transcriptional regulator [Escherichia coli]EJQ5562793.1 LysR family transcriptional regulator [Escherichia coli]ELW7707649.1 LysR family transcriptional regulator [Escherichia coli]HCO6233157.1 LysR family transcriptional regulator [Escherichia coli]